MNTPFELNPDPGRVVYVKAVSAEDLPVDIQDQLEERDHLYAVHAADGEQLALVADRKLAFVLARQNDYSPVNVH